MPSLNSFAAHARIATPQSLRSLAVTAGAALTVLMVSGQASAAPASGPGHMLELHGGSYGPAVDGAFGDPDKTPWADTFGAKRLTLLRGHFDWELWDGFGTLAAGLGAGYGWVDGFARDAQGEATEDEVGFNVAPVSVSVAYRLDWAARRFGFPLVPYGKLGLTTAFWWATNARDDIATAKGADGATRRGAGVTFGWQAAGGVMFLLDVLAPGMAASMQEEAGVRNSFLFAEYNSSVLDDFGGGRSLDLSDDALSFGLAFEF
jgi:hypothetical protein